MRHRAKQMSCVDSNLVIDAQSKQMFNPKLGKITKIFSFSRQIFIFLQLFTELSVQ